MTTKPLAIFILILTAIPFKIFAVIEECPMAVSADVHRIAGMARDWDYMHDAMLAQTGSGDQRTEFETVIDEGCLRGLTPERRAARIASVEAGLASAISQIHTCGQTLGFVETADIIAVLRRTRIRCGDLGPSGLGSMQTHFDCPGSGLLMTAGANRRYEMTVATPVMKNGQLTDGPNFENMGADEFGSLLSHEAMHVLAMNNRSWHNDLSSRAKNGCDNSLFYDRVLFTESACFPNVRSGTQFYADNGPYQCTELCISALTDVDQAVIDENTPAPSPTSASGVYGPSIVARPYPIEEARRICERIRANRGVFPASF